MFFAGKNPTWIDEIYCYGNESRLSDCKRAGTNPPGPIQWNVENCRHDEDVGVICRGSKYKC